MQNFPYYDVHSALWMKLLPAEWGWDVMDVEYDKKQHGEVAITRYVLYKQPRVSTRASQKKQIRQHSYFLSHIDSMCESMPGRTFRSCRTITV